LHSPEYLQCALVLQHPHIAGRLGEALAVRIRQLIKDERVASVASPAIGGLIIGYEVARSLGARFIFAERGAGLAMTLRRGFAVGPSETVVVVEDVVTTGGSTREVVDTLKTSGANVLAAASIIDRSAGSAEVGVPRLALHEMRAVAYPPEECPLCRDGIPVQKPGSRPE
jgi:orotate phosphoribosyltransferase